MKTSITYFCFQLDLFLAFSREWINNSRNKQVFIVLRELFLYRGLGASQKNLEIA